MVMLSYANGPGYARRRNMRAISGISIHPEGEASLLSCISNLTNTIIGTGMLATPGAFKYTGLLLGMFLILFCAFTSALGLYLLTRCAAKLGGRKNSFFSIATQSLPAGAWWFDLAIALKCYGVSISYLIICGQLMPQVIISFFKSLNKDIHEIPILLLDRSFWILTLMILLIPLCFLRRLDSLRHTSYLSLMAVMYLVMIVIHYSFSSTARASLPPAGEIDMFTFSYHTVSVFPVFVFAFTCAQNMLPVYNELYHNDEARVNTSIISSIGTGAVVYQIVGVLGYLTFGSNVGHNIIAMYPSTSLFVCFGRVSIIVLTLFSYPLQVHPCRASLDKVLSGRNNNTRTTFSRLPNPFSTTIPPYRNDQEELQQEVPTTTTTTNLVSNSIPQIDDEIPLWKWCLMTAGILSTTFIVSLVVDDLSLILGFVGSVGSTTISFILPAILYLSLHPASNSSLHSEDQDQEQEDEEEEEEEEDLVTSWISPKYLRKAAIALGSYGFIVLVVALSANIVKLVKGNRVPDSLMVSKLTRSIHPFLN